MDRKDAYLGVKNGVAICLVNDPTFLDEDVGVADLSRHLPTNLGKDGVALGPVGWLANSFGDVVATVDVDRRANLVHHCVINLFAILREYRVKSSLEISENSNI